MKFIKTDVENTKYYLINFLNKSHRKFLLIQPTTQSYVYTEKCVFDCQKLATVKKSLTNQWHHLRI
jgi:hypothetical protein